jgi:cobalt/nickel transport system ATP-binding protein
MTTPVFELNKVNYSYLGRFSALNGIDLTIQKGEKIVIIGANGSGKSTLLQLLDGLIFPDSGRISAFGTELTEKYFNDEKLSREFRSAVGLVFQNPDVQLFCPTVKEDIVFGPLQLGLGRKQIEERLEKLINLLEIKNLLDRVPHQLSLGEKRKIAIASTLIINPQVLILDEPTAGLDPLTTRHIIDLLVNENLSGKTIITATHDLHIVQEISDRIHVFNQQKKIVRSGSPEEILTDIPFLQENNLVHIHSHMHNGHIHLHPHAPLDYHHEH